MIILRLASLVAALVTITLNAHHGFISAKTLEYAILFAILYGTLDLAKVSILVAAVYAWRVRAYATAFLCLLLFPPLFLNSVWNALSQVAITRDAGKADQVAAAQARARAEAEHARLTTELAVLQASATFKATAACTQATSRTGRATCQRVQATLAALATTSRQIEAISPTDPQPQVTLLASVLGIGPAPIQFTAALVPVLLAEIVGSLGFTIAAAVSGKAPQKPTDGRLKSLAGWGRRARKTRPDALPEPSGGKSMADTPASIPNPTPKLTWTVPGKS
jgi:hypothetical protein